jgi:hypothetical protein
MLSFDLTIFFVYDFKAEKIITVQTIRNLLKKINYIKLY